MHACTRTCTRPPATRDGPMCVQHAQIPARGRSGRNPRPAGCRHPTRRRAGRRRRARHSAGSATHGAGPGRQHMPFTAVTRRRLKACGARVWQCCDAAAPAAATKNHSAGQGLAQGRRVVAAAAAARNACRPAAHQLGPAVCTRNWWRRYGARQVVQLIQQARHVAIQVAPARGRGAAKREQGRLTAAARLQPRGRLSHSC